MAPLIRWASFLAGTGAAVWALLAALARHEWGRRVDPMAGAATRCISSLLFLAGVPAPFAGVVAALGLCLLLDVYLPIGALARRVLAFRWAA